VENRIEASSTVLLLNDIINANLRRRGDDAYNAVIEASGLLQNVFGLVAAVRPFRVPVFWVRVNRRQDRSDIIDNLVDTPGAWHGANPPVSEGSYEWELLEEATLALEDQVIVKPRLDPFIGTDLDLQLRARRVKTLAIGGYSTNIGVEACARTAHDLGYDAVIASDCCWNVNVDAHESSLKHNLPRVARVMPWRELVSRLV
jgi:nicotinamidase-related amidase